MSYKVRSETKPLDYFQTFEDLEVYNAAREFRKAMDAVSRRLPADEKYVLVPQIRKAAVSLISNIAEGHDRFHYPDQIRFFLHSRGSLEELVDDLNTCLDERYLAAGEVMQLKEQARGVLILLNGYVRYLRARSSSVREDDDANSVFDQWLEALPM